LQWKFEEQMTEAAAMQFRATVAFLLEGVPHHTLGEWQPSKSGAKRDAAERALELFIGSWGRALLQPPPQQVKTLGHSFAGGNCQPVACWKLCPQVVLLEEFCGSMPCPPPKWRSVWEGNKCKALAELVLVEVPHHFAGAAHDSEFAAFADTARRVLWYMNCPGFADAFEPDPSTLNEPDIADPPRNWMNLEVKKNKKNVELDVATQQPKRFA
jgi:hypothetical protein